MYFRSNMEFWPKKKRSNMEFIKTLYPFFENITVGQILYVDQYAMLNSSVQKVTFLCKNYIHIYI